MSERLPRTRRGQGTLENLLRCAEAVLSERGYEAASVSAICRRAGVAQGTFYLYFSSKEDAYVRLAERLQRGIISHVRQAAESGRDGTDRLLQAYAALLDFVSQNVGLLQVFREAGFTRPGSCRMGFGTRR
ncbi:MAG: helix-turn-helix domain-containing protein [Candidatus Bipolaricaulota bacterium]